MACKCFETNNVHKHTKMYSHLLDVRQRLSTRRLVNVVVLLTTLPFCVFLVFGFIPRINLTTQGVSRQFEISRAIWAFRPCMPH